MPEQQQVEGAYEAARKHYDNPDNLDPVGDRFAVYSRSKPNIDIHANQVQVLKNLGLFAAGAGEVAVVCDVGAGKGDMNPRLRAAGFAGLYVAIDRSLKQLRLSAEGALPVAAKSLFVNAPADRLPIHSGVARVVLANFVLYHETAEQRLRTYSEMVRVARSDGVLGMSTSSILNKSTQRQGERFVALKVGSSPPPEMTADWTSELADTELATNFPEPGWYKYDFIQRGYFTIETEEDVDVSIKSIRTSRDQYRPMPDEKSFEAALEEYRQDLLQRIQDGYPAVDNIGRSFSLLSRIELPLPKRTLLS